MLLAFGFVSSIAHAQGPPLATPSASTSAAGSSAPPQPAPLIPPPSDDAGASDPPPRPVRSPSVRERSGRRSRGASTASGVLFLVILVGAMGWYVVKRLRR
jgi:hypothetical protein